MVLFFGSLSALGQNTVKVEMYNFDNNEGSVMVGLYASETSFLNTPSHTLEVKIEEQKAVASFTNIPDGVYAISVFHDENSNKKLDMLLNFLPTEDYGASNNAPARFGPPKWEDAKFELKDNQEIVQRIRL